MTSMQPSNWFLGVAVSTLLACIPPRGGWDVDALVMAEPSIAALEGQRLGDMIPFPAPDGDRIMLVACRFAPKQLVRVRGGGSQWPTDWGRAAVGALNQSVDRVELILEADGESVLRTRPDLGDTLSECDVSSTRSQTTGVSGARRGLLIGAEIRMRRARLDMALQVQDASAEEWIGALMHELAHALGFAGHAAAGPTILVQEESRLRAAGRHALDGRTVADPTLEALYLLRPGQGLGTRSVKADDVRWLHAIRKLDHQRSAAGRPSVGMLSSVGDDEARVVWRYSDGSQLGIRFPYWRSELRSGAPITLRPDLGTKRLLAIASRPGAVLGPSTTRAMDRARAPVRSSLRRSRSLPERGARHRIGTE